MIPRLLGIRGDRKDVGKGQEGSRCWLVVEGAGTALNFLLTAGPGGGQRQEEDLRGVALSAK